MTELNGAQRIARERERQIEEEGYAPEGDLRYADDVLALAGAMYATPPPYRAMIRNDQGVAPSMWPWGTSAFKSGDRIRDLEKAGALLAAEIDRLLARQIVAEGEMDVLALHNEGLNGRTAGGSA